MITRQTGDDAGRPRGGAGSGRILSLLACATLLLAAGCGGGRGDRPARPDGPAAWVAPEEAALDGESARVLSAAGVEEIFLEAATLTWEGTRPVIDAIAPAFDGAVPRSTPVTLVVRGPLPDAGGGSGEIDPREAGESLGESLRELALRAEERGLLPLGVHLEPADGATLVSPALLRSVRSELGAELLLSTTVPRTALASEEGTGAAAETARAVDFVVVFLYGHPVGAADDPEAWDPDRLQDELAALDALGADFVAGLHVMGSAWHLSSAGERVTGDDGTPSVSTRAPLEALARNPALRLGIDPFGADGRLVYTFEAQGATRVPAGEPSPEGGGTPAWRLAPGESVRVSRTSPALVRWVLDALESSGLEGYAGPLFHRVADPGELLGFEAAEMAAALGARSTAPELEWGVVVESRQGNSIVLRVELSNRGRQSTDLATAESRYNYLEVRSRDGHFVAIEPGDFHRYSLRRGDEEARPGIGWREPDGVRLSTPLVDGGERVGGATLTLRTSERAPRIAVGGRFLLTGGEVLELPMTEGRLESALRGTAAGLSTEGEPAMETE